MTIIIHYIDKNWNLIFKLINMKLFMKIHNAVYFIEILNNILKSFKISYTRTYLFLIFFSFYFLKMINYSFFFLFFFNFFLNL